MPHLEPLKKTTPPAKVKHHTPALPKAKKLHLPKRDPRSSRSR